MTMATERFPDNRTIDRLVADLRPVRPRRLWCDASLLGGLASVEMLLVANLAPSRSDLAEALTGPMFWWRLLSCLAIAATGAGALLATLSPAARSSAGQRSILAITAVALLAGLVLAVVNSPPASLRYLLDWREGLACVAVVELYALPTIVATTWLARRWAPPRSRAAAFSAELASAAWGAAAFVWWCPHDDALYILV